MDGYEATRKIREWEVGKEKSEVGMRNAEKELSAQSSKQEEEKLKAQGSKLKGKDSEDLSASSFQPSARPTAAP